jgi:hypothetical protein
MEVSISTHSSTTWKSVIPGFKTENFRKTSPRRRGDRTPPYSSRIKSVVAVAMPKSYLKVQFIIN